MAVRANARYSDDDHVFRERDPYARAKYDLTLRWLGPRLRAGATLYNVGVGGGHFNRLAAARGVRVVGCEPDEAAYEAARASAPTGCELFHCDLDTFARGREAAPLVVMHDVLEHVEDDRAAAATLRRLVRSDGVVVLSVPALMRLFGYHDEALGHYRRYTPRTLRAVLEPSFTIVRLRWFGLASIPIAWYFSRWRRQAYPLGGASSLGGLYAKVCAIESYLPEPIGTSLIVELAPRG